MSRWPSAEKEPQDWGAPDDRRRDADGNEDRNSIRAWIVICALVAPFVAISLLLVMPEVWAFALFMVLVTLFLVVFGLLGYKRGRQRVASQRDD